MREGVLSLSSWSQGISQRDPNYYDFWNERDTQQKVLSAVSEFWEHNIKGKWEQTQGDCTSFFPFRPFTSHRSGARLTTTDPARFHTASPPLLLPPFPPSHLSRRSRGRKMCLPPEPDVFDFLLTRDLSRGHIVDFNPYHPRTDPLLFTYDELHSLLLQRAERTGPELRVVDSPAHPAAARNAPAHQHNMVPIEALAMSAGRDVAQFADAWQDEIRKSMAEGEESDEKD